MRYQFSIILVIAALLAACTAQAQPSVIPVTASTDAPAATAVPAQAAPTATQPVAAAPTTAPAASSNQAGSSPVPSGSVDFKLVPGESVASYEVGETFFNQNNRFNLAVGKTSQVTGDIYGNKSDPTKSTFGTITVDISQLTSDSSRRDNFIRGHFLESSQYPLATFTATKIENLPAAYTDGKDYSFKVTGDLTVHKVTKAVTFEVTARLSGDTLTGKATAAVKLSDFGVGPINLMGMLQTQDDAKINLDFVARP
jgi:polyisoprenoid-binding protein YceI